MTMKHNDKIQQLLDLLDHQHEMTDEQLNEALQAEELNKLAGHLAKAKGALLAHDHSDNDVTVDAAWAEFEQQHRVSQEQHRRWWQKAAIFAGVLLLSSIAFAAIFYGHVSKPSATTATENAQSVDGSMIADDELATEPVSADADTLSLAPVTFDNEPLDQIVEQMASYYQVEVVIENDEAHNLRFYYVWHPSDNLAQAIEKLNTFEHVDIVLDNQKLIVK